MKKSAILSLGFIFGIAASSAAIAASDEMVVVGVPDGRLAAGAIVSGDFQRALNRLEQARPDGANDPARLINLGNAYAGLGRMKDAHDAYRAARFAPDSLLVLANGTEESSRSIAHRALGRIEASYAMR